MNSEYAFSLFTLGKEENLLDDFYNDVKALLNVFKDKDINLFLENRFIKGEEKKNLLKDTLKEINKYIINFINIVIDDNKIDEIKDILENFIEFYYKEKNISKGVVYGISLDSYRLKELEDKLSKKLNKTILLEFIKDDSLIGGYKVVVDNILYDNSYKRKLDNLKENLLKEGENND